MAEVKTNSEPRKQTLSCRHLGPPHGTCTARLWELPQGSCPWCLALLALVLALILS